MPFFVSAKERDRLLADIDEARQRAERAEARLHEISLAAMDAKATKDGGYPLSARLPQPNIPAECETLDQHHERLKASFPEIWEYYLQVATDNGKDESEAMGWLECHAEGRPLPFETAGEELVS